MHVLCKQLNVSFENLCDFLNSSGVHMEGQIWFLSRSLQLTSFQAYKLRVTHLYQLKQHSILVSVGQDEHGINPLVNPLLMSAEKLEIAGIFNLLLD